MFVTFTMFALALSAVSFLMLGAALAATVERYRGLAVLFGLGFVVMFGGALHLLMISGPETGVTYYREHGGIVWREARP